MLEPSIVQLMFAAQSEADRRLFRLAPHLARCLADVPVSTHPDLSARFHELDQKFSAVLTPERLGRIRREAMRRVPLA